eukprot:CAMPEP_0113276110 /NCGR_PEP_ID=MMETSP0008_2-20120614/25314_1 /TAXON_ID=97485 /ORGANISM="Prymnesium parvum" /LENGTH=131 /DNA_ID=CAMNT_0000125881 /DNA_START=354 /DNA_END=750 /DNA_ORIENTATION=- /assembly_acc=CAM_ASM_000153
MASTASPVDGSAARRRAKLLLPRSTAGTERAAPRIAPPSTAPPFDKHRVELVRTALRSRALERPDLCVEPLQLPRVRVPSLRAQSSLEREALGPLLVLSLQRDGGAHHIVGGLRLRFDQLELEALQRRGGV